MVDLKEVEKELYDVESRRMTEEQYLANRIHQNKITPTEPVNYPDAKKHQLVSFIKSAIRIAACVAGLWGWFEIGFVGLLLAEIVGIYEELV